MGSREINIIEMVKKVLAERKSLVVSLAVGAVCGVIIAICTPKEYKSEVILVPELSSGGLGLTENLADMASSFGINLDGSNKGMDALYPEIYPEVLSSNDFIQTLFDVPVRLKKDDTPRSYFHHMTVEQKIPFWDYPKIWLAEMRKEEDSGKPGGKADPFKISLIESEVCKAISGNISCLIDKKTSVILIAVTDQDPLVAAIMADTLQNRLQEYITKYRTKKARNDYKYYASLHKEAKVKYEKAQNAYASFCDSNQDMVLERFVAKRDGLENEMQMAFSLMQQMTTQMNAAKAKIQERTPAYTMIKSAKMPYKASSMSRVMIVLLTMFFAFTINAMWILFLKDLFKKK